MFQLEIFLLQLRHHSARFSALGFFEVSGHILTSVSTIVYVSKKDAANSGATNLKKKSYYIT